MGWFSRRREQAALEEKRARVHGKAIRYAARRVVDAEGNSVEHILGKKGAISVVGDDLVVMCDGTEVFRCLLATAECSELMSLGGMVISGENAQTGESDTVVAYYTKF